MHGCAADFCRAGQAQNGRLKFGKSPRGRAVCGEHSPTEDQKDVSASTVFGRTGLPHETEGGRP
ncbi:MAG: hypothetical protein QXR19_08360 [Candidatus Jordarchaeaceae archaeon]